MRRKEKRFSSHGYIIVHTPTGSTYEHRVVMERYIGRPLLKTESVHHINGDKSDNRLENLMMFKNETEHHLYEIRTKVFEITCKECGVKTKVPYRNFDYCEKCRHRKCVICGKVFRVESKRGVARNKARKLCSVVCRNIFTRDRLLKNNPNKI